MTAGRSPVELLDTLDALRAEALSIRQGYPSEPQVVQHETEVEAEWSDGGRSVLAECYGEDVAEWLTAAANALPDLISAVRGVLALADDLDADAVAAFGAGAGPVKRDLAYRYAADRIRAAVDGAGS